MKLNTCPHCGANLDPCERCDCEAEVHVSNSDADQLKLK